MSGFGQKFLFALAGLLGKWLIATYYMTVRIVDEPETLAMFNRNPSPPGVYAFWHSHQLSAVWHFRRVGAGILISASKDGEYIARIARSLNFVPMRGSSSRRGAAGLKGLIALGKSGRPIAITPDGPKGPRYTVNPGILAMAQSTGHPIVPFGIGLSSFWELPSWDKFRIPKPFSRGISGLGRPIHVPTKADEDTLKALAEEVKRSMLELEERLDKAAQRR